MPARKAEKKKKRAPQKGGKKAVVRAKARQKKAPLIARRSKQKLKKQLKRKNASRPAGLKAAKAKKSKRAKKIEKAQKRLPVKAPPKERPAPTSKPAAAGKVTAAASKGKDKAAARAPRPARGSLRAPPPLRTYKFIGVPSFTGPNPVKYTVPPPPPQPPPPPPASLEERISLLQSRLSKQAEAFRQRYVENLDMSWIYHDSALEGVVYSFQELKAAIDPNAAVVQDSTLQPVYEEIRCHKQAIDFVRDFALKKRLPVTLDIVKQIFLILHPGEGDLKTVKYRKDIPQHRLYFHEYAPPDKITYKVRQIVDWINDPETRKGRNALRIAARAHYDLLRVFPFAQDSGKVARLLMNLLLLRGGYEPAIIHSTERQRYYEALKGSAAAILHMVTEAEENGLASIEKLLDEHETNTRSFVS
jgi:Fic family protein